MRIISTRTVILYAFIFGVFATVSAQTSKVPNISGKWWKDKTEALWITQTGDHFTVTFDKPSPCPSGGARSYFLEGTIEYGRFLKGMLLGCTRNLTLKTDCHLTDPYEAKFTGIMFDDQLHISIGYLPDYITYKEKNGHYTDCSVSPGAGKRVDFEIEKQIKRGP